MNTIEKTITVSPHQVSIVMERLEKMNKKAIKLGINPATILSQEEYNVTENHNGRKVKVPKVKIIIRADLIKFGNYDFIAALDHTVGNKPIVKVVPNKVLPEVYQNAGCNCDHCGIKRQRNDTFIFQDNNGFKQVGRSCLKEFFGIDPTQSIDWFTSLYSLSDNEFSSSGQYYYSIHEIVSYGLAVVEKHGYISKKAMTEYNDKVMQSGKDNYIESTSNLVVQAMNPPIATGDNRDIIEWCRAIHSRRIELSDDVDNIIKWGVEHFAGQSGEYAHNMGVFLTANSVEQKYFGYVVSVIGAYNRDKVKMVQSEANQNDYIGNIGDKVSVDVSVIKIITLSGQYGYSYMNIMQEANTGNNIIWVSSSCVLNEGEGYQLKGTIKKLGDREGKKQTFLTRCKVL
jgi:hypothetical protein